MPDHFKTISLTSAFMRIRFECDMPTPRRTSDRWTAFVTLLIAPLLISCQGEPEASLPREPTEVASPPQMPSPPPATADANLPQPPAGEGIDGGPGYDL